MHRQSAVAAGTGKTRELVARIVNVLATGGSRVDQVLAVTFTEKEAGELKLRLREGLERARHDLTGSGADRRDDPAARLRYIEDAVAHLEEARVCRIHGFCADLLHERPVEADVDPQFDVLAEVERTFGQAFDTWLQQTLAHPPEGLRRALRRRSASGFGEQASKERPTERLKKAATDLTEWRDFPAPWRRKTFERKAVIDQIVAPVIDFAELVERVSNRRSDRLYLDVRPAPVSGARDPYTRPAAAPPARLRRDRGVVGRAGGKSQLH